MKTLFSFSTLIVMAFLSYQAVQPEQLPAVKEAAKPPAAVIEQAAEADCREPILADRVQRARLEAQILASTARVRLETWSVASNDAGYEIIHSENHATVKDGRTLVTHNHFDIPLSLRRSEEEPEIYTIIFIYSAAGELRHRGLLSDFAIAMEDPETLLLAHGDAGFLTGLGFTPAAFAGWDALPPLAGAEVAQVDWDGGRSRVDWVTVGAVAVDEGTPRIELADGTLKGASGGGIFWNGRHIANNWKVERALDAEGEVVFERTTAALNSPRLLNG